MDGYVTVQESGKHLTLGAELPLIVQRFHKAPTRRWSGFDSGKLLTPCASQTKCHMFKQGEEGPSVTPTGRWSGFQSRGALTRCRQSQRKRQKSKARRQGVMKWTVLLSMATPPPCKGEDDFSSFTTLQHWGTGVGLNLCGCSLRSTVRKTTTSSWQSEGGQSVSQSSGATEWRKFHKSKATREGSISQFSSTGRWSGFESGVADPGTLQAKWAKNTTSSMQRRGGQSNQWGAGVGLSQSKCSHPAGKARGSATSSGQGDGGQAVNPVGRWTVTKRFNNLGKAAHPSCSVATDYAGGDSYCSHCSLQCTCAAPSNGHPTTLQDVYIPPQWARRLA
eukprot:5883029-Prymnesium_polylepis.1